MRAFDALVGLQLFDHNFHRAHQALRLPGGKGVHRYHRRSPAMALELTDHLWSFQELLTTRIPITLHDSIGAFDVCTLPFMLYAHCKRRI